MIDINFGLYNRENVDRTIYFYGIDGRSMGIEPGIIMIHDDPFMHNGDKYLMIPARHARFDDYDNGGFTIGMTFDRFVDAIAFELIDLYIEKEHEYTHKYNKSFDYTDCFKYVLASDKELLQLVKMHKKEGWELQSYYVDEFNHGVLISDTCPKLTEYKFRYIPQW
jgi:hypothetical protein